MIYPPIVVFKINYKFYKRSSNLKKIVILLFECLFLAFFFAKCSFFCNQATNLIYQYNLQPVNKTCK